MPCKHEWQCGISYAQEVDLFCRLCKVSIEIDDDGIALLAQALQRHVGGDAVIAALATYGPSSQVRFDPPEREFGLHSTCATKPCVLCDGK